MAYLDKPNKKWRVRWRLGGGRTAPWQTLMFDDEDDAKTAIDVVKAAGNNITPDIVWAAVFKLDLKEALGDEVELEPETPKLTVSQIAPGFLEWKTLEGVELGSVKKYREQLDLRILPAIGALPVADVTTEHILRIMAQLRQCDCVGPVMGSRCRANRANKGKSAMDKHSSGLSWRTADRYFTVMKGLFSYAVDRGLRADNPVKLSGYKTQTLARYNSERLGSDAHFYMPRAQYEILRSRFSETDQRLLDFMAETGARFGEATAARVGAIDTRGRHPVVVIDTAWKEDEHGYYLGKPKSGSTRRVPVKQSLLDKLQPALDGKQPDDLIFPAPEGGQLELNNFYKRSWNPAAIAAMRCPDHPPAPQGRQVEKSELKGPLCCDHGGKNARGGACRAKVAPGWDHCVNHLGPPSNAVSTCACWGKRINRRPTVHDLRHTHVAWLLARGIPLKAISLRLGHASVAVTETVYAGLLAEVEDAVVAASDWGVD